MKRHVLAVLVSAAAAGLAGACALPMSVSSHVDRSVDFAKYRTFDWGPADALPTGDPRLDRDPFFQDHFQGAVQRELVSRGIRLASSSPPDLLVHYHANVTERIDVNQVDRAHGYCGSGDCPPEMFRYEAGTLVLDLMDAQTNKLVWRGWAQNRVEEMLGDRDRMEETIDQAVRQMLRRLPRGR
jgi:hypothetical protein